MTGKTKDWKGVTGGNTLGQKGILLLFHLTNITVIYVILALVVPFYMLFSRKGYLSIYRYFNRHFHYSRLKSFGKTYRNHYLFGQCMIDRFAVYAGRRNLFRLDMTGEEYFYEFLSRERGFIMASSHVGNFELGGYLLKQDKKHINALVYAGETEEIMKNRKRIMEKNNISVIPVSGDLSHIFSVHKALSAGEVVSMPCDRNLGSARAVECSFLEGKADFPLGPFILAAQFDVPILAVFIMKESATRYHVIARPVHTDIRKEISKKEKAEAYATAYAGELEKVVRMYPEQWFNYYQFWKE